MTLNRLFDTVERNRETADWRAAFGEPQQVEGKTLIPVATVSHAFGLGFGSTESPEEEDEEVPGGDGGGEWRSAGGGAMSKPLGAVVVTPEDVYFKPALDQGKVTLVGLAVGALLIVQFAKTLRAIFGRD